MLNLNLPIMVQEFAASRKYRAATAISGQIIMGSARDTTVEAVMDLFACLANRNAATASTIELAVDVALAGFDSPAEMFKQLAEPQRGPVERKTGRISNDDA